jgi:tetratricopeptide (TPR) repeat protein
MDALRLRAVAMLHGDMPWPEVERELDEMRWSGAHLGPVRGFAASSQGRYDDARQIYEENVRELREQGQVLVAALQALWYGYQCELFAGELGRAEAVLREGWDALGEMGERGVRSTLGGCLGEVLARRGKLDEAEAVLDEALAIGTPDDWVTVSQVDVGRAFVALGRGEDEWACKLALRAVDLVDANEYLTMQQDTRLHCGEILLAAGRLDAARTMLERAREVAARKGSTALVATAEDLLAGLAN